MAERREGYGFSIFQKIKAYMVVEQNRVRVAGMMVIVYVLLVANWRLGHLRLTSPTGNSLILMAGLLLPADAAALLLPLRRPGKVAGFILLLLVSLVSLPLLALIALLVLPDELPKDVDASCEFVRRVARDGPPIRVYQTNGGAMTSFGIIVQQERTLLPGVIWVTRLSGKYPAEDVTVTVLDRHHIRCTYPPYDNSHAAPEEEVVRTE